MSQNISVIGAGSVGVATALHLQQRGWDVTLIDRNAPARETSYGNAGIINIGSMIALNSPMIHKSLARLLKNNKPQLRYNIKHVLKNLPWAIQFLQSSKTRQSDKTCAALFALTSASLAEHKSLMQRAGNMSRLTELGWLRAYRNGPGFDNSSYEAEKFRQYDIPGEHLGAQDLRDLEPSLKHIYSSGYLLSGAASIDNPGELVSEYAQLFVAEGGKLVNANVNSVSATDDTVICHTDSGNIETAKMVIAAGPWSNDVLGMLNYTVPLGVERGYHAHYTLNNEASLKRSVYDVQSGFIMSPMEMGLRITTGVDLDNRDAPPNHSQLEQVLPSIKEAIDLGERTDDPIWQGNRPTLPDSVPAIGKVPNHDNVWVAFGHQHIGLMTGPITGRIVAELISGESTDIDVKPYDPARYIRSNRRRKPIWSR